MEKEISMNFYLVLAILLIFPLGQLTRLTLFSPEVHIYWHDLMLIALLSYYLIILFKRKRTFDFKLVRPIISFFAVGAFSLFLNSYRFFPQARFNLAGLQGRTLLISSLYLFRWMVYAGIFFIARRFGKKQKKKALDYMIFAGVVSAFFGLAQYFFFPDARSLVSSGWDPHLYRVIGTFLDPGYTGLIYVFTLVLIVDRAYRIDRVNRTDRTNKIKITGWRLAAGGCYSAFALSYARSAYLAFLVAVWTIAYLRKSVKFALVMSLLLAFTLVVLPRPAGEGVRLERQNSIWSRFDSWQKAISIWREKPIFGIGFNTYRYVQAGKGFLSKNWEESHAGAGADASLLFVLATTGVTGLTVYSSLLSTMFRLAFKKRSFLLLPTLTAVFIHSFFNNSLFYPWVMVWIWVLTGCI